MPVIRSLVLKKLHDVPNVSVDAVSDLDDRGIIRIGAEVHAGDRASSW